MCLAESEQGLLPGRWCEACQQAAEPQWRYILSVTAQVRSQSLCAIWPVSWGCLPYCFAAALPHLGYVMQRGQGFLHSSCLGVSAKVQTRSYMPYQHCRCVEKGRRCRHTWCLCSVPGTLSTCALQDHTGQQWLTAFEESGCKIIGQSANDLKQKEGTDEFERIIQVLI